MLFLGLFYGIGLPGDQIVDVTKLGQVVVGSRGNIQHLRGPGGQLDGGATAGVR